MDCWIIILICLSIIFAPQILGALFYHHVSDEEIVNLIGNEWKDQLEIKLAIIEIYSTKWGGPVPYPSYKYLRKKLSKLVAAEYLEFRVIPRYEDGNTYEVVEYRQTHKKYPKKKPKNFWLVPKVCYEGAY